MPLLTDVSSEVAIELKVFEDVADELDMEILVGDKSEVPVFSVIVVVADANEFDEYVFISVVAPDSVDCVEIGVVSVMVPLDISGELGDVKIDTDGEGLSWVVGNSDILVASSEEVV